MKTGGGLGSESMLLRALRMQASSRVLGYPSLGKISKFQCSRMP